MEMNDFYDYIVEYEVESIEEEFFLRSIKNICDSVPAEHTPLLLWKCVLDMYRFSVQSGDAMSEAKRVIDGQTRLLVENDNAMTEAQIVFEKISKQMKSQEVGDGN
jgi:hypothetical protein